MTILYSLVARGKTVLAEFTFTTGNFPTITRVLLGKIAPEDGKMSYVYDQHVFHYRVDDGLTFLCMADEDSRRRIPFAFLQEIKNRFQATYGDRGATAAAFAMNEDFSRTLENQMDIFNSPDGDQILATQQKLDEVKDVMVASVELVLERGERLELLVDKTDNLQQQAFRFENTAKRLKNHLFWKRVRFYSAVTVGVLLLLYIITALACGPTYTKCKSS
eukprot:g18106.t1